MKKEMIGVLPNQLDKDGKQIYFSYGLDVFCNTVYKFFTLPKERKNSDLEPWEYAETFPESARVRLATFVVKEDQYYVDELTWARKSGAPLGNNGPVVYRANNKRFEIAEADALDVAAVLPVLAAIVEHELEFCAVITHHSGKLTRKNKNAIKRFCRDQTLGTAAGATIKHFQELRKKFAPAA